MIAATVVAAHLGAAYALTQWSFSAPPQVTFVQPLQVAIVAEEPLPQLDVRPPPVQMVNLPVTLEMPLVNLPAMPEPARAITVVLKSTPSSTATADSAAAQPKLISAVDYLKPPRVRYPAMSRRLREEGLVVLRVLIDIQGKASRVDVHRSSGHERLDSAAREAVSCAKFKPYSEGGISQPAQALVPIEFSLNQRVAQR